MTFLEPRYERGFFCFGGFSSPAGFFENFNTSHYYKM